MRFHMCIVYFHKNSVQTYLGPYMVELTVDGDSLSWVLLLSEDKWVRCKNQGRRFILGQDRSNFWYLLILFSFLNVEILYVLSIW
jgi:hypothetical protein